MYGSVDICLLKQLLLRMESHNSTRQIRNQEVEQQKRLDGVDGRHDLIGFASYSKVLYSRLVSTAHMKWRMDVYLGRRINAIQE